MNETAIAVSLHHATLPKLADAGLLEYDPRSKTARYSGPRSGDTDEPRMASGDTTASRSGERWSVQKTYVHRTSNGTVSA